MAAATQDIAESLAQDARNKELFSAISQGNYDAVKLLVQAGVDIEARDEDGYSFLMVAAHKGHLPIVKYLMSAGADINSDVNLLDYDEEYDEITQSEYFADTPIRLASENGHFHIVEYLVSEGADVNFSAGGSDKTALYSAAKNGHATVVKSLLEAGADIANNNSYNDDEEDDDVCPALMAALRNKHKSVIEVLLTYADIDIDANELTRAFINAAMSNSVDIVLLFLQHHATTEKLPDTVIIYIYIAITNNYHLTIARAAQNCIDFLEKYTLVISDSENAELTKKTYRIWVRSRTEQLPQIEVGCNLSTEVKTGLDWKWKSTRSSVLRGTLLPMIQQYGISNTMGPSNYQLNQDIKRYIEVNLTQTYPLLQLITEDEIAAPYIIVNLFKAIFTTNLYMATETAKDERRLNFLKLLSEKYNYLDLNALITAGFSENAAKAIRDVALTLQNQALEMVQIINKVFDRNCALSNQLILQYAGDLPDPYSCFIDAAAYPGAAAGHGSEAGATAASGHSEAATAAHHSEAAGAAASAITSVVETIPLVPGHQAMQLAVCSSQIAVPAAQPVRSGKAEAIEEDVPEITPNLTTQSTTVAEPVRSGLAFLPMLNLAQQRRDAASADIAQQRKRRSAELTNTASTGASAGVEQQIPAPNKLQDRKKLV